MLHDIAGQRVLNNAAANKKEFGAYFCSHVRLLMYNFVILCAILLLALSALSNFRK